MLAAPGVSALGEDRNVTQCAAVRPHCTQRWTFVLNEDRNNIIGWTLKFEHSEYFGLITKRCAPRRAAGEDRNDKAMFGDHAAIIKASVRAGIACRNLYSTSDLR